MVSRVLEVGDFDCVSKILINESSNQLSCGQFPQSPEDKHQATFPNIQPLPYRLIDLSTLHALATKFLIPNS
jgi:hypothetical protein